MYEENLSKEMNDKDSSNNNNNKKTTAASSIMDFIPKKHMKIARSKKHCLFCERDDNDEATFGEYIHHKQTGFKMHYFCLVLSSGLRQTIPADKSDTKNHPNHVYGFTIKDIVHEVNRASRLRCSYCKKTGASIGCVKGTCQKKMHYGCGRDNKALSRFYGTFNTWCEKHRPKEDIFSKLPLYQKPTCQDGEDLIEILKEIKNGEHKEIDKNELSLTKLKTATTEDGTNNDDNDIIHECVACRDQLIPPFDDANILISPCCFNIYSHKICLQRHANSCGLHFFRCPGCNNMDEFQQGMLQMGIYIPNRDASWEQDEQAFSDLYYRHNTCDKPTCKCPHGRDYSEENTKWKVILCDLCGSSGTHIACTPTVSSDKSYYGCRSCTSVLGARPAFELATKMGIIIQEGEDTGASTTSSETIETSPSSGGGRSRKRNAAHQRQSESSIRKQCARFRNNISETIDLTITEDEEVAAAGSSKKPNVACKGGYSPIKKQNGESPFRKQSTRIRKRLKHDCSKCCG